MELTPEEHLEYGYQKIREGLAQDLLNRVKEASPSFFERLVVELLVAMGYGGSLRDAGRTVGRSGDGGIDGVIKEDRLGLDVIYIQAKRWESTVGRPDDPEVCRSTARTASEERRFHHHVGFLLGTPKSSLRGSIPGLCSSAGPNSLTS